MNCTLYIPYSISDPEKGFKYDGGKELSDKKYMKMVVDDFNTYDLSIGEIVNDTFYGGNGNIGSLTNSNVGKTNFMRKYCKGQYSQQSYEYFECRSAIFDIKNNEENIDELLDYYKNKEQFVIIIKLIDVFQSPEFETEFRMWTKESRHINGSNKLSEEEKIYNLPKKDIKISFDGTKSSAILKGCKILEVYSNISCAILVSQIQFIKN